MYLIYYIYKHKITDSVLKANINFLDKKMSMFLEILLYLPTFVHYFKSLKNDIFERTIYFHSNFSLLGTV